MDASKQKLEALQHLPPSPVTNSWIPGRLVPGILISGDLSPGILLKGKARKGFFSGQLSPATMSGPHSFSQTMKCHGGGFSRATLFQTSSVRAWRRGQTRTSMPCPGNTVPIREVPPPTFPFEAMAMLSSSV
ncbi:hypothetical protein Tco_0122736 [Tanacetum coccineum]